MNYNKAELCKDCKKPVVKIDKIMLREMVLVLENDSLFYRQRLVPWAKNMARKLKRGVFNKDLFLGGLARNLAKPAQMRYYQIERMGNTPVLTMGDKMYLAQEFYPAIEDHANDIAGIR